MLMPIKGTAAPPIYVEVELSRSNAVTVAPDRHGNGIQDP